MFLYPLSSISLSASIFMTVALSVERYWAVCQPSNYRNASLSESQCRRVLKYIVPVLLASFVLNATKFLETSVEYDPQEEKIEYNVTDLRKDPTYIWYMTVMYSFHPLVTTELGPIITLLSLNVFIFLTVRLTKRRFGGQNQRRGGHGEINLARVIVIIVAIFVICHLPRMVLAVVAVVKVNEAVTCVRLYNSYHPPLYLMYAESISHLLLLVNSSVNFLIYCFVATRFRVFMKRFMMCESREVTSNLPFGVSRLAEAPFILVNHAIDNPAPINIIRSRFNSHVNNEDSGDENMEANTITETLRLDDIITLTCRQSLAVGVASITNGTNSQTDIRTTFV